MSDLANVVRALRDLESNVLKAVKALGRDVQALRPAPGGGAVAKMVTTPPAAVAAGNKPTGRPPKVPRDDPRWATAQRMWREGWSAQRIAGAVRGLTVGMIGGRIEREKWPRPARKPKVVWEDAARVLYEARELKVEDIAAKVGVSSSSMRRVARERKWTRRPVGRMPRAAAVTASATPPPSPTTTGVAARAEARSPRAAPRPDPSDAVTSASVPPVPEAAPHTDAGRAGAACVSPRPAAASRAGQKRQQREKLKVEIDALFCQAWNDDRPLLEILQRFRLRNLRGVRRKATLLGLLPRACDAPPAPVKKRPPPVRAPAEVRAAAEARMAALATTDAAQAARLFLQRKGVVVFAASVVDGASGEGLLKVDGRNMSTEAMVEKAVRLGFDAGNAPPLLRRVGPAGLEVAP